MLQFLMKIFRKPTKICDHCGTILKKNDPAICLHGTDSGLDFELYICEPCCEKIAYEYDSELSLEEFEVAENRNDYPE
mgnify:CR=1 FL=1